MLIWSFFWFQLMFGALLAICSAAKLDSTYLPPGANGAGGGPGISPPFRGSGGGGGGGGGGSGRGQVYGGGRGSGN